MASMTAAPDRTLGEAAFVALLKAKLHGKSVAIVGNSPRLLESDHGPLIDSHDVVIRFNDADITGLGMHTGYRTSFRLVGFTIKPRHEEFFQTLREDSVIITKKINRGKIPRAGIRGLKFLGFSLHKNAFALADVVLNSSFADQNSMPPRTGFALLSYILSSDIGLQNLSLFGMERTPRKSGRAHFYDDKKSLDRVFKSYHLFHAELEAELAAFNMMLDRFPDLIRFH
jgi:hypothetical protein